MLVKVGNKLQINLQLEGGETDKYPIAILRDSDGVELDDSPVSLTHVGDGLYSDDSVDMPDTEEVTATYKVYDNSGHTVLTSDYYFAIDVYQRDDISSAISALESTIAGPADLEGVLDDDGELIGEIEDC